MPTNSPMPFVFKVAKSLCEEIDRYCAKSGDYRSRGEFDRAAFEEFLDNVKHVRLPILLEQRRVLEASRGDAFRGV